MQPCDSIILAICRDRAQCEVRRRAPYMICDSVILCEWQLQWWKL